MPGALDGIRVVDFGQYIAGPFAAMLLADQGADVVRVDPPGGPRMRTSANAVWNRGKRSIVLDLKRAEDVATARRLVETSDVVVENFRPGVMERLGIGAAEMTAANPALIWCSLPGFASDDPRAGLAAWEGVVESAAAGYSRRSDRPMPEPVPGRPLFSALPTSSMYGAFLGTIGIAMALNARERDGAGQRVEVPLFDATFTVLGYRLQRVHDAPARPERAGMGGMRMSGMVSLAGFHQCADDRWVYVHSGNKNVRDFVAVVGADAWSGEPDARERVTALFRSQPAKHWEDVGHDVGTEVVMLRTSEEWLREPHARESRMVVEVDDPEHGRMLQPGVQVRMSATPGAIRGPARPLDADADRIRSELATRTAPHVAPGPLLRSALEGVKVLDLCIVLAGPTCGRTLAEFGANVIKIEGPPRRQLAQGAAGGAQTQAAQMAAFNSFNLDINRGKRSVMLDLKTDEGREVFWKLAEDADVVVENFRRGVIDRLGVGYEDVRKRRPDIVYASLNTYGYEGPWAGRPGHEQLAQSGTGMALRFGGDGSPTLQNIGAVNDYGTGLMGAYGVALALLHRRRTGRGQHVNTGLAYTAVALQSLYMHDFDGKTWDEPRGHDVLGWSPLQRLYEAADGWMFVGAHDAAQLVQVEGLEGATGALEPFLEERFAGAPVDTWVKRLTAAGVGAHRLTVVDELMDDPWVRDHGLVVSREHDGAGLIDTLGVTPRLSRTPPAPGRPAPVPGAQWREILQEHGLGGEIDRLVAAGGVHLR